LLINIRWTWFCHRTCFD